MSEAEGGCQERWEDGATSSSQEKLGGGGWLVQLVVLGKISSQGIDRHRSQLLFYFVPRKKNFQSGLISFPSNLLPLKQHLQLAKNCSHLQKVTSFPF